MVVVTKGQFKEQANSSSMHLAVTFFKRILATQDDHIIFITEQEMNEMVNDWLTKGYSRKEIEEKFGKIAKVVINS